MGMGEEVGKRVKTPHLNRGRVHRDVGDAERRAKHDELILDERAHLGHFFELALAFGAVVDRIHVCGWHTTRKSSTMETDENGAMAHRDDMRVGEKRYFARRH